jgi:quercetin dioxygenase-like cupin family protein
MKKIIITCSVVLGAATLVMTAAEREKEKASAATSEHKIVAPAELKWGDAPPGLPPGGQMAVLDGDPTKPGMFTVRLKAPAGYKIPPHTHPTAELVTGISGSVRLGMGEKFDESAAKEVAPGTFAVLPAGMAHFAFMKEESILQIHGQGPFEIKYVNPADDPRQAKK